MTEPVSRNADLVSAIVTTYHGDDVGYLREALESLFAQTLQELEVILVLDGRVEGENRAFIDEIARSEDRLRVVELEENRGPSTARNAGIQAASGVYIAMLDSDDIAKPDRLASQRSFLNETGADVVGSFYEVIDENGDVWGSRRLPCTLKAIKRNLWLVNPIAPSMLLGRSIVLKENLFDPAIRYGEDYELCIRLLRKGFVLRNQAEYLVKFRTNRAFTNRRRGLVPFRSDLRNRTLALGQCPPVFRPFALLPALTLVCFRLLPTKLLALVYRFRGWLRFGK